MSPRPESKRSEKLLPEPPDRYQRRSQQDLEHRLSGLTELLIGLDQRLENCMKELITLRNVYLIEEELAQQMRELTSRMRSVERALKIYPAPPTRSRPLRQERTE